MVDSSFPQCFFLSTFMLSIHCFGISKDIVGASQVQINPTDIPNVKALRTWLANHYPAFSEAKSFMIAVNQEYAFDDTPLQTGDEIAIIPPVSGG